MYYCVSVMNDGIGFKFREIMIIAQQLRYLCCGGLCNISLLQLSVLQKQQQKLVAEVICVFNYSSNVLVSKKSIQVASAVGRSYCSGISSRSQWQTLLAEVTVVALVAEVSHKRCWQNLLQQHQSLKLVTSAVARSYCSNISGLSQ